MRDITKKYFFDTLEKRGIYHDFCGYYKVTESVCVYAGNAGDKRRARLAYLIKEQKKALNNNPLEAA